MGIVPQTPDEYRQWWREHRPGVPYGECWCGCGQSTSPARQRDRKQNYFQGEPMRYARGHGNAKPRISSANYNIIDTGHQTPCWLWTRYLVGDGYACLYERGTGKPLLAHRLYYEHHRGAIPEGLELDHLCRQTACVNPEHLEPVTTAVNQQRGNAAKLNPEKVLKMRGLREQGLSYGQIGRIFDVASETARAACIGRRWKNVL